MHPDLDLDLLSLDNFLAVSACSISLGTSNLIFGISGCSDGVGDIFFLRSCGLQSLEAVAKELGSGLSSHESPKCRS